MSLPGFRTPPSCPVWRQPHQLHPEQRKGGYRRLQRLGRFLRFDAQIH